MVADTKTPQFLLRCFWWGATRIGVIGVAVGLRMKRGVLDALGNDDDVEQRHGLVLGVSDARDVQSTGAEECGERAELGETDHVGAQLRSDCLELDSTSSFFFFEAHGFRKNLSNFFLQDLHGVLLVEANIAMKTRYVNENRLKQPCKNRVVVLYPPRSVLITNPY